MATKTPAKATTKVPAKKKIKGFNNPDFKWETIDQGSEIVLVDENKNSFKDYLKANNAEEAYAKTKAVIKNYNSCALKSAAEYANAMENKDAEILSIKTSDDEFDLAMSMDVKWKDGKIYSDKVNVSTTNPYEQELNKFSPVWGIVWED